MNGAMSASAPDRFSSRPIAAGGWVIVTGLAAVLAWTTLGLGGYLAENMVVTAPAVFALAALGGLLLALERGGPGLHLAAWLPVPFVLYAAASAMWLAPARWLAWREVWLWIQAALVLFLVLHFVRTRGQRIVLVATMAGLGAAGVAMAAYQRFVDPEWLMLGRQQAEQFVTRSAGMFGSPNALAGLLELMIPAGLVLLGSRAVSWPAKILAAWLAALFLFALVLTGSRGGWIATGLTVLAWPLLGASDWRRKALGLAVAAVLVAGLGLALHRLSPAVRERAQPFLEGKFEASRPLIWRSGLKLWADAPWLGTGAASYNVLFDRHRPDGFQLEPEWTHNDYLNTLGDYGVVGFVLWVGCGAGLGWLGWRAVRRARRELTAGRGVFGTWRWKYGLWLGLLAWSLHLAVDFHTKLPALAMAAASAAGLLLQDETGLWRTWRFGRIGLGLGVAAVALPLAFAVVPRYQAEAIRQEARRKIDGLPLGKGNRDIVLPAALPRLEAAAGLDPSNAFIWNDLAHVTTLMWHVTRTNPIPIGRRAEAFADRALALAPAIATSHVWKGVALDMQGRQTEGGASFRQALALAPNRGLCLYYYAYHLSVFPERQMEAIAVLDTCLSLDPGNSGAVVLRERLLKRR